MILPSFRSVHLTVGLTGVAVFLLTGQYMHHALGHLAGMEAGPRMLFRSAHIYLLWSSLLNLVLGCYLTAQERILPRTLQTIGSVAVASGPILLCLAFFYEPYMQEFARPFARAAIYGAFAGCGASWACSLVGGQAEPGRFSVVGWDAIPPPLRFAAAKHAAGIAGIASQPAALGSHSYRDIG